MQVVPLGATGLQVTHLGLGTVELGLPYGIGKAPPPDDEACLGLLHRARDLGVTYFDTAAAYGRSEELVGRAFPGSHGVVIATKVALRDADGRPWGPAELADGVAHAVDRSRRRLGVDAIDLLQIHSVDDGASIDAALLEVMAQHTEAGAVRNWGVSTYGRQAPMAVLDRVPPIAALQVAYSVLDRTLEEAVLPRCRVLGVGVILRSVFLQGVLSERRHHLDAELEDLRRAAAEVAEVADALGITLPELALRFALHESGAHVALVGTAHETELDANLQAAAAGPLPPDAVAALRQIGVADEDLLNPGTWPTTPG